MKLTAILCAALISTAANAVLLAPGGGPVAPDNFTGQAIVPLASNANQPFTSLTPAFTGLATTAVFIDLGTHDLDFLYQVSNNASSADAILRLTASNFAGFVTDVGFRTDGAALPGGLFVNGAAAPATVDRGVTGDTIGFNSAVGGSGLVPGATSNVLEIKTNATQFTPGNLAEINASIAEVRAFAPTTGVGVGVAEPGTLVLLGVGLVALALLF